MIQNILVPVDLSESSLNALNGAAVLAKKHGAAIQILHIEENAIAYTDETVSVFSNSISNPADILTALASTMSYTHGIQTEILLEEGNVLDTIINKSLKLNADLIVMGTHGASGYRDSFIGSNSYSVIKYAPCPVLCIPVRKKVSSFRNVLFPIRPVAGGLMLYSTVRNFTAPNSTIDVLGLSYRTIETDTSILNTIVDEIKEELEIDQVHTKVFWGEEGVIAEDILRLVQRRNADLLVISAAIDGASKPRFIGPHAQKVINCAKLPILCISKVQVPSYIF